jgi:Transposase DDE domain
MRYIPPSQLYRSLYERLIQLLPNEVDSRLTNMVYLMLGIFLAKKVQTGVIATKVPLRVKRMSIIRRLERFLDNGKVRVRGWYESVAVGLLQAAASSGRVALIIDGTKVSFHHQLLMVAIVYHRRALPIAWTWVAHARGHSTQAQQLALLRYVHGLLSAGAQVSLVGDTEFGHTRVLEELDHWHWDYALRQSGHNLVMTRQSSGFQPLESLLTQIGDWLWMPSVVLTQANAYPTNLMLCWMRGDKRPWLLVTNLTHPPAVLRLYARRMWIEALFGDLKGHGFDLESSHLRSFLHLSRLTLAVALLYVWLVTEGSQALIQGRSAQLDRADRHDLSVFRLGLESIEQALTWGEAFSVDFLPVFVLSAVPFFSPKQLSGS